MSLRELKNINKQDSFQPRPEWFFVTREELIKKAQIQSPARARFNLNLSWFKLEHFSIQMAPKLAYFVLVICLAGGLVVKANAQYRPDSALYALKQTVEKVELAFTFGSDNEAKVQLKHSNKRKEEALKIVQDPNISPAKKVELIAPVVKSLENNLVAAKASLDKANLETTGTAKENEQKQVTVTQIAKDISTTAKDAVSNLDKVKEELTQQASSTADVSKTIQEVNKVADKVAVVETDSLKVLVEKKETQKVSEEVLPAAEIKGMVEDKINRAQEKVAAVNEVIKSSKEGKESGEVKPNPKDVNVSTTPAVLNPKEIKEAVTQSDKAKDVLIEAKKDLNQKNDLTEAVSKSDQSEKLIAANQVVIEKALIKDQLKKDNNSTSTTDGQKKIDGVINNTSSAAVQVKVEKTADKK